MKSFKRCFKSVILLIAIFFGAIILFNACGITFTMVKAEIAQFWSSIMGFFQDKTQENKKFEKVMNMCGESGLYFFMRSKFYNKECLVLYSNVDLNRTKLYFKNMVDLAQPQFVFKEFSLANNKNKYYERFYFYISNIYDVTKKLQFYELNQSLTELCGKSSAVDMVCMQLLQKNLTLYTAEDGKDLIKVKSFILKHDQTMKRLIGDMIIKL